MTCYDPPLGAAQAQGESAARALKTEVGRVTRDRRFARRRRSTTDAVHMLGDSREDFGHEHQAAWSSRPTAEASRRAFPESMDSAASRMPSWRVARLAADVKGGAAVNRTSRVPPSLPSSTARTISALSSALPRASPCSKQRIEASCSGSRVYSFTSPSRRLGYFRGAPEQISSSLPGHATTSARALPRFFSTGRS